MLSSPPHLGLEDADDGEHDAVEANGLTDGPAAGEELGLGFGAEDADVGALLVLGAIEEATLIGVELDDVGIGGARADHGPGVGVKIVLYRYILIFGGRDVNDFREGRGDAVDVVEGKRTLTPALSPPACWLVLPGKKPMVLVPHWAKMVSMAWEKPLP